MVTAMGGAAVAAGADDLIVEVHADPPLAMSDGAQSLYPDQFASLMDQIKVIARAIGWDVTAPLSEAGAPTPV
jgi:3-deoxy-7-phosphoheptulonate synthase